ncbi:cytochrome c biogenesis CcdA family protein [Meiothermus taiwanensis]|uniref:Thiol:disulfide interchange protein DsbD n=2 Tax=Meiothermus taiwanensis TaxID=172827 RepID=A0A399E5T0_9DEIN|nr:cytochrome c biogenesis CcdA family protein [Meiothermus taiwanensis]AWR85474.1 cytochrome c biogenesis protein transmembrane region [Meiothermus taiwanensis WR-220]KIQ55634.1 cytochrome C biogenesis protein CcmH [Meiothermus taiwanensis]KZK16449.1 cytochrome C biogenesis protein CcmH [Meiothermus taiwanensis]RIH80074.1 Thiol:disulfide interchange protein DsbD [Meiothermus taiwanensis]
MTLSLPIAFLAGVLSFLSPCVLPLVPTYLLYLGGQQGRPIRNALFFVLGFSAIFFLLGLPFTLLGSLLFEYRDLLSRIGGGVLILLGLYMLGLRPRWGVNLRYEGPTDRPWGAFVLGIVLGLGWTPCIGPILGGILTLTATGGGIHLLVAYILGLAVPFLLVALFAERARAFLRRAARLSHAVELVAGVVLIAVGVLLITGTFTQLNSFFLRITPEWLQKLL